MGKKDKSQGGATGLQKDLGGDRLHLKALIENGKRQEIKRDAEKYKEVIQQVERDYVLYEQKMDENAGDISEKVRRRDRKAQKHGGC